MFKPFVKKVLLKLGPNKNNTEQKVWQLGGFINHMRDIYIGGELVINIFGQPSQYIYNVLIHHKRTKIKFHIHEDKFILKIRNYGLSVIF